MNPGFYVVVAIIFYFFGMFVMYGYLDAVDDNGIFGDEFVSSIAWPLTIAGLLGQLIGRIFRKRS